MTPNTIVPRLTDQTGPAGMMAYLVDSYERAQLQEKHLSKVNTHCTDISWTNVASGRVYIFVASHVNHATN